MKKVVGANLKKFRIASEYTQQDVATFLGVDRGAYANYELGEREMPFELTKKICNLYGIAMSILFETDEAKINSDLVCAFRLKEQDVESIEAISEFKDIVRSYLKMKSYM
jgi:transcriptional regulator with XRE-family HTH domain